MLNPVIGNIGVSSGGGSPSGPGTVLLSKTFTVHTVIMSTATPEAVTGHVFSFTIPASGKVYITVNLYVEIVTAAAATASVSIGLGTTLSPSAIILFSGVKTSSTRAQVSARIPVSGTPGSVYSSTLYAKKTGGTSAIIKIAAGNPGSMLVIEA